jgi:hypothetical protein
MPDSPPPQSGSDAPPPPPPPQSPAAEHRPSGALSGSPPERFRAYVAVAIALVSILGAMCAFTGTLAEQGARQLDQQGIQDDASRQQIITSLNGTVNEDLRNLAPYQEEVKAADVLQSQAATLDDSDPTSAALLRAQAESELVLARTQLSFFRAALPDPGPSGKPAQYDPDQALQRLENDDPQLGQLKPDATIQAADTKHEESINLAGLVTLFIAALLFLTLAQFTRPAVRRLFAGAGAVTATLALLLWILVLVTSA